MGKKRLRLIDDDTDTKKRKKKKLKKKEVKKEYRWAGLSQRTELDDDLIEQVADLVSKGHAYRDIADRFCIPNTQLFAWRNHGERYLAGEEKEEWEICSKFVLALRAASGTYGMNLTNRIHNDIDWNRSLKVAERRMPEVYGVNPLGGPDDSFSSEEQFL